MYPTGTPVFMYLGTSVQSYSYTNTLVERYTCNLMRALGKLTYSDVATRLVYRHSAHEPFSVTPRVIPVRTYIGTPVRGYTGTPIHWCTSTLVRKYTDTPVRLYSCTSLHGTNFF